MRHLTRQDYTVSQWSGGSTTQLAIAPPDAIYADRDFLWRLSSATVELDSSDFTPLPDYQRFITVLDGAMTLTHDDGAPIPLTTGCVHAFDGGSRTRSVGRCTDLNLMLRKGACQGSLRAIPLAAGEKAALAPTERGTLVLFCRSGSISTSEEGQTLSLAPGECILAEHPLDLTAAQPSLLFLAEVCPAQPEA